ncbi:MAG: asparaginase domain-containing protein [Gammaproteobacteria bacterium]|nr:asparaginase domain-containing protein [Gammaproteobacteria bacterium]
MMKLHIITTGGTIDKIYFDAKSDYQVGDPVIGELLQRMNARFEFSVESVLRKDSLDLTDADRQLIRKHTEATDADCVLVTHGTDGMVETASWLSDIADKRIVLTGALQPAAFYQTDAIFNIGCAIGAVQSKPPGVYIAMNGQVFDGDKVIKNREQNCFEALP